MPKYKTPYVNVNIEDAVKMCRDYMLNCRNRCRFTEHDIIARVTLTNSCVSAESCSKIWDALKSDRLLYYDIDTNTIGLALYIDMENIQKHLRALPSSSPRVVSIKGAGAQLLMSYIERFGSHFQLKIQDQANRVVTLSDDTGYVDATRLHDSLKTLTGGMSLHSYAKQMPVDIIANPSKEVHVDSFMPFDHDDSQRVFYVPHMKDSLKEDIKACIDEWKCYCAFFKS